MAATQKVHVFVAVDEDGWDLELTEQEVAELKEVLARWVQGQPHYRAS